MKSGFVAIVGVPNVGKSTIINSICKTKISITSPKAQTTRDNIKGIYNDSDSQIIFIDTPGLQNKPSHELGKLMNKSVRTSLEEVDAMLLVVDASKKISANEDSFRLIKEDIPLFIILNKIDLCHIDKVLKLKGELLERFPHAKLIETSAIRDFNSDEIVKQVKEVLEEGPRYFDEETVSDHDDVFMMKEVIREHLLIKLKQEVPHQCAVIVEKLEKKDKALVINAAIIVEKKSQKAILIGKQGKMIKSIGTSARKELEKMFKKSIYLDLYVKVKEDWQNSARSLKEFGYQ